MSFGNKSNGSGRFNKGGSTNKSSNSNTNNNQGNKGGNDDFPFINVGSVYFSKKTDEGLKNDLAQALIENKVNMWFSVFLPKGADTVEISNKQKLLISFSPSEKDPEYVIGRVMIPKNGGQE